MALLEIRKPAPQGGFYQYTAQVHIKQLHTTQLHTIQLRTAHCTLHTAQLHNCTLQEDQTPNQAEIDRQQAVLETTADCIIPRLPQVRA